VHDAGRLRVTRRNPVERFAKRDVEAAEGRQRSGIVAPGTVADPNRHARRRRRLDGDRCQVRVIHHFQDDQVATGFGQQPGHFLEGLFGVMGRGEPPALAAVRALLQRIHV